MYTCIITLVQRSEVDELMLTTTKTCKFDSISPLIGKGLNYSVVNKHIVIKMVYGNN